LGFAYDNVGNVKSDGQRTFDYTAFDKPSRIRKGSELKVDEDEITRRNAAWLKPAYKAENGVLRKYIATVKSASLGCVTDELD
jgi:dihydroxyacid dehydratase/phosphogluconate dehydratase